MKRKTPIKLGIVSILLATFIAIAFPALRTNSPSFNWLFSPSDLYKPLAVSAIDLREEGKIYRVRFENKYPGRHRLAILVEEPQQVGTAYDGDFVLHLEVYQGGEFVFSEVINGPGDPFWGRKSGFEVRQYRSPEHLAIKTPLEVRVSVLRADQAFAESHGPFEFVVNKVSDE